MDGWFLHAGGFPVQLALVVLVSLVLAFASGFGAGWWKKSQKVAEAAAASATKLEVITKLQPVVTEKIVTKYIDKIVTIEGKGLYVKEVIEKQAPAARCTWPGSYRLWHDAAASGNVPRAGWETDATAEAIEAAPTFATIDSNYRNCQANAAQLTALQQWVKEQRELAR